MDRITAADFKAQKGRRKSKYGNESATVNGIKFDSKREANRYLLLLARQQSGEIRDLELQVEIPLMGRDGPLLTKTGRPMIYRADFRYIEVSTGLPVIEDAKGMQTKEYLVKKSVAAAQGVEIIET